MTNPKREALLVLLAQSGDRDALESLLRDVQTNLLRYITGVVGSFGFTPAAGDRNELARENQKG